MRQGNLRARIAVFLNVVFDQIVQALQGFGTNRRMRQVANGQGSGHLKLPLSS